jgi:molybdenum cofactor cytidylyltransferase
MRKVGAVILAAGGSSRLGQPKQLLTLRGETLVCHAVRAATDAPCAPVVVVVGESGSAIRTELRGTSAIVIENLEWQGGLGTSVRCGTGHLLEAVPGIDALVLMVCDQPLVEAKTIAALIAEQERTGKPIVASSYANTLGVPALFDRSCFDALLALPDDSGAKALIASRPNDAAAIAFEAGAIDIDTPGDYQRLQERGRGDG